MPDNAETRPDHAQPAKAEVVSPPRDEALPTPPVGFPFPLDDPRLISFFYSSPYPLPSILEEYEKIVPGSAKRIIDNAHAQTRHRQELEKAVVLGGVRHERLGVIIAGLVAITSTVTGGIVAALGQPVAGTTIATATVVALAGVFVYGTDSRRREREAKAAIRDKLQQGSPAPTSGSTEPSQPFSDSKTPF